MTVLTTVGPTILASFMASLVEFVEALTIVLAVGVVRGWRPALLGAGAGAALLAILVLSLGPSLARIPLPVAQVVVGTLLLMFGLRWLRKAVLRAAGVLALHDEDAAYASQASALRTAARHREGLDKIAFLATFKSVVLEGLEVVFIVLAIGASGRMLAPAVAGAALALALVVVLGLLLHRPLSRVPENALKFGVGAMLSAFGTFWAGEGLGLDWAGGDRALLVLIGVFGLVSLLLVPACVRMRATARPHAAASARVPAFAPRPAGPVGAIARELIGLFVDDGWLAVGILAILASVTVVFVRLGAGSPVDWGVSLAGALLALLSASVLRRARA